MRTFLLLALTFLTVNGSEVDIREILLQEIMQNVNDTLHDLPKTNLNHFVRDIFHKQACSDKILCKAAKILDNTLPNPLLQWRLFAYAVYTGHQNCSVSGSRTERPMKHLLVKIKDCCRVLFANLKKK